MNRSISFVAGSLVLWGVWLILSMIGKAPEFDGLAFMFAAVTSSQIILFATKYRNSDVFKTLLVLQGLINLLYLVCVFAALSLDVARHLLMYAVLGQLVVAYTVALRLKRRGPAH